MSQTAARLLSKSSSSSLHNNNNNSQSKLQSLEILRTPTSGSSTAGSPSTSQHGLTPTENQQINGANNNNNTSNEISSGGGGGGAVSAVRQQPTVIAAPPPSLLKVSLEMPLMTPEQLYPTPSMKESLAFDVEFDLRLVGCELIQTSGRLLKLPQVKSVSQYFS
jgi:hypothetical protein